MSMRDEIRTIADDYEKQGRNVTAEIVVEAANDAAKYPHLNEHLWQVPEADLVTEARIARAHRLLISIRVVSEEGATTRLLVHTPGTAGYRPITSIVGDVDLASIKLRQLTDDIARSRGRLRDFKAFVPSDIADAIDAALETAEQTASRAIADRPAATAA